MCNTRTAGPCYGRNEQGPDFHRDLWKDLARERGEEPPNWCRTDAHFIAELLHGVFLRVVDLLCRAECHSTLRGVGHESST